MPQARINPWEWQDQYRFSQAIEVSSPRRSLKLTNAASKR